MDKKTSSPLITPLQSPKIVSKNMIQTQQIRNSRNLTDIKQVITLTFEHIQSVYKLKFTGDNPEDRLIFDQFSDLSILDLIRDFMAYILLYDEKDDCGLYTHLYVEIKSEIRFLYRMLMGRVLGKIHDYFKILVMLAYFVFYFLVDMEFYDISANHLNFLIFCFEVVHFEINGINIQPSALKKIILQKFQNNYKVPKVKKSLANVRVASSAFDNAIKMRLSAYIQKSTRVTADAEQFKNSLESKVDTIKNAYRDMVDEFKVDIEKYKKNKDKSFELQHIRFRMMKNDRFRSQDLKTTAKVVKDRLNVNSMSQGLLNNTFNPKKQHYISELTRDHSR